MYKIAIYFNQGNYEYDVHSLVKAFFPESEIVMYTDNPGEEGEDASRDLTLQVIYEGAAVSIRYNIREDVSHQIRESKGIGSMDIPPETKRAEEKNLVKTMLYHILSRITGRRLPWGTLTGIRPTKIAMKLIEEGRTNVETADYLREKYLLSNEKTALCVTIANRERAILKDIDYEKGYSLYVGIPFCPSICLYCSFSSSPLARWEKRVDEYVDTLCYEIRKTADLMKGYKLNTIYMGGGTPTTLTPEQLDKVLSCLGNCYSYEDLQEFTVEAGRPDSITREKLQVLKRFPVTRISVNPQTMNQETLDIIGRRHTVEDTRQAFYLARELGFDNINMDLIIGLPGEDQAMMEQTLKEVRKLDPDSITVHSLAVKRAARLNLFKDQYREISFENSQEIMDMAMEYAHEMNMGPYYLYRQKNMAGNFENVGYSREGKAGIYNILIMEEKQSILALGAGGATKLVFDGGKRVERVENVKDPLHYLRRIDEMIERKRAGINRYLRGGMTDDSGHAGTGDD